MFEYCCLFTKGNNRIFYERCQFLESSTSILSAMKIQISTITHSAVVWWCLSTTFFGHRFLCRGIYVIVTVWQSIDCMIIYPATKTYYPKYQHIHHLQADVLGAQSANRKRITPSSALRRSDDDNRIKLISYLHVWNTHQATTSFINCEFYTMGRTLFTNINHKYLPISLCVRILLFFHRGK